MPAGAYITVAPPKTLGIFCYDNLEAARDMCGRWSWFQDVVIKCVCMLKEVQAETICTGYIRDYYHHKMDRCCVGPPPAGTIFCTSVYCLEIV